MIRNGTGVGGAAAVQEPGGEAAAASAADRYCAWSGRARRRVVFVVRTLDPADNANDAALDVPGVLLGVLQEARGRRVLWSAVIRGGALPLRIRRAVADLRRDGRGELHIHAVAGGPAACDAVATELGLPPLDDDEPLRLAS